MTTKITSANIEATGVTAGSYTAADITVNSSGQITSAASNSAVVSGGGGGPKISGIVVTDNAWTTIDDTAVDVLGGYIKITGTGFSSGCLVYFNQTPASSVSFVSSTELRVTTGALSAGTYVVYAINTDGGVAIRVPGITFSASPGWQTASSLSDQYDGVAITLSLVASDATSYTLVSGSLPPGLSLNASTGAITGTVTGVTVDTSYTFTVRATDAQNQESPRTFTVSIIVSDPYFNRTTLLLSGSAISANTVLRDSSTNNFNLTAFGDARASNFTPYGTGWSVYFDGTGDSLVTSTNAAFAMSSGDFTVEAWVNVSSTTGYRYIFDFRDGSGAATNIYAYLNSGTMNLNVGVGTTDDSASGSITLGAWAHVALVRSGSTITVYINGVSTNSFSSSQNFSTSTAVTIGGRYTIEQYFIGYISNFRVVKGTAVYTANFTPPTSPLTVIANTSLLTCNANRLLDASTNNFAITRNGDVAIRSFNPFGITNTGVNGSAYFDGTGDYITVPDNANLEPLGGNFTIETWFYLNAVTTGTQICGKSWWAPFYIEGTNLVTYLSSNGSTWDIASNQVIITSVATFRWYHVAMVRNGTSIKVYVNGTETLSLTSSAALHDGSDTFTIGARGTTYLNGYVADLRFVKGTAVYTGNFTPPTQPLTAIANTQLLTLQYDQPHNNHTFLDSSSNQFLITRSGNTTQGTFSPFSQAGWSVYINNGTSSQIRIADNAALRIGTSAFTIESWVYPTSFSEPFYILRKRVNGNVGAGTWAFTVGTNGAVGLEQVESPATIAQTSAGLVALNTWTHVAVSRDSSNNVKIFVNGTIQATATSSYNFNDASNPISLLCDYDGRNASSIGYASNLRFVIGSAVYTTNFTPATSNLTSSSQGAVAADVKILTFQNNRFRDASTNNFTITTSGTPSIQAFSPFAPTAVYSPVTHGGSAYFDGSDWLQITDSANQLEFGPGVGAGYLEIWYYPTQAGTQVVLGKGGGSGDWSSTGFLYQLQFTSSAWSWYWKTAANNLTSISSGTYGNNQWFHVVVSSDGTTFALFVNGVRIGTNSTAAVLPTSRSQWRLGQDVSSNWAYGYCAGLKIVRNTVPTEYLVSATSYTVPTAPVVTTTNTQLLLNFTDAAILDSTGRTVIETVADARTSSVVTKFTGGSMYFDGTGDGLAWPISSTPFYQIVSTNWTIEMWMYKFSTAVKNIMRCGPANAGSINRGWSIGIDPSINTIYFSSSGADNTFTGATIAINTWVHLAFSYTVSDSTLRVFYNGTSAGTKANPALVNPTIAGGDFLTVATPYSGTAHFDGYLSDIRFTQGYARYTANFTPPTGPARLK